MCATCCARLAPATARSRKRTNLLRCRGDQRHLPLPHAARARRCWRRARSCSAMPAPAMNAGTSMAPATAACRSISLRPIWNASPATCPARASSPSGRRACRPCRRWHRCWPRRKRRARWPTSTPSRSLACALPARLWLSPAAPRLPARAAKPPRPETGCRGGAADRARCRPAGLAHRACRRDGDQPVSFPAHLPAGRRHDALSVPAENPAAPGGGAAAHVRTMPSRRSPSRPVSTTCRPSTAVSGASWARRRATIAPAARAHPLTRQPCIRIRVLAWKTAHRRLLPWRRRNALWPNRRNQRYPFEITTEIVSGKVPRILEFRPRFLYKRSVIPD